MKTEQFKTFVTRKPFQALRIQLHAGDPVIVRHPETILLHEDWAVVAEDDGPRFFEVNEVVSVQYLRRRAPKRSNGS